MLFHGKVLAVFGQFIHAVILYDQDMLVVQRLQSSLHILFVIRIIVTLKLKGHCHQYLR